MNLSTMIRGMRICALAVLVSQSLYAENRPTVPTSSITQLAWLAGSWRVERNGRLVDEQWMTPAGGVMPGMTRTLVKGRKVETSFAEVREGPGGDLFYIAHGAGAKNVTFKSLSVTPTEVVFVNQLEDFPQTISYTLRSDGTLLVVQAGPADVAQPRRLETVYRRVGP